MASDCDFFESSQTENMQVTASLPCYLYNLVILFEWGIEEKMGRFKVFERKLFPEIKDAWIKGQLKPNSRFKKLKKLSEEAGVFSLFGKIESGMYCIVKMQITRFMS